MVDALDAEILALAPRIAEPDAPVHPSRAVQGG
jgi:hypothetical protein